MWEWGTPNSKLKGQGPGTNFLFSPAAGQLNCTPGELSCVDGSCVGAILLCDGIWDCPDGADEGPGHCPLPSLPTPPAGTLPGPSTGVGEIAPTPPASTSPGECPGRKGGELESWGRELGGASQRGVLGQVLG